MPATAYVIVPVFLQPYFQATTAWLFARRKFLLLHALGYASLFLISLWHSLPWLRHGRLPPDLGYSPASSPAVEILQGLTLSYLFTLYCLSLYRWRRLNFEAREIAASAVMFAVLAWSLLPANSTDIFEYIGLGRLAAVYGVNPYLHSYSEFTDTFAPYITWNLPMPYGPMALPVFMLGGVISQINVLVAVYLVKLMWLLVHLGNAWLVYRIAKARNAAPEYALFLFACNPLILLEQLGNGHNDGLMICCGLLALFALQRGRGGLAVWLALLSGLVKLPGIFWWVAIALYLLRRHQLRGLVYGLAASLATLLAVKLAFFPNRGALLSLTDNTPWHFTQNSLHTLFIGWGVALCSRLKIPLGYEEVFRIDRLIFTGLLIIFCVWRLRWIRDFFSLTRELAHIYLGLLLGYAELLYPWYATWLLPLAALTDSERLQWAIVAFSCASPALYAFPYFLVEQARWHWLWAAMRLAVALAIPLGLWLRCFIRTRPALTVEGRSPIAALSGRSVSLGAASR